MERITGKVAMVAFSRAGAEQALRAGQLAKKAIADVRPESWGAPHSFYTALKNAEVHVPKRVETAMQTDLGENKAETVTILGYEHLQPRMETLFQSCDAILCFGATGIVVRSIAPYLRSKYEDPAVLVCDENARYVISLLSGHVGNANSFTEWTASLLHAQPVITTASDTADVFAVDSWAEQNGYAILNPSLVKTVTARLLENKPVVFFSDIPVTGAIPKGLTVWEPGAVEDAAGQTGLPEWGICISENGDRQPFAHTLQLVPRNLVVGVGCRKGTSAEALEAAWTQLCTQFSLQKEAICTIASIDIKKEEAGLLRWARSRKAELLFYTAEELVGTEGDFPPSEFVKQTTGVDNVCQRAAAEASRSFVANREWVLQQPDALARCRASGEPGVCLVPKQKLDGITMAIYRKPEEIIRF